MQPNGKKTTNVEEKIGEEKEKSTTQREKLAMLFKMVFEKFQRSVEERLIKTDHVPMKIMKGLYIGSIGGAKSKESLEEVGITHVVSCASIIPPQFPDYFEYLHFNMLDKADQGIDDMLSRGIPFIKNAIRSGGKVFVHCFAGKSRATTMCCAFLIETQRIPFSEALIMIQKVRPIADPNVGFRFQLVKFARSLGIDDPIFEKVTETMEANIQAVSSGSVGQAFKCFEETYCGVEDAKVLSKIEPSMINNLSRQSEQRESSNDKVNQGASLEDLQNQD